ncbi:GH23610 [Drosophila grimshawi]|uniref:GH23610 n=1 Tax=Drosophila grimshawi TaxID=7222 RepID=B4K0P1_DROGR|nr:GH23610 [Drosophila grimshawi]
MEDFRCLFEELGPKFLIAGDWNAQHHLCGAALDTRRGITLADCVRDSNLQVLATGGATHSSYGNHRPTAIDFAVYAGIRSDCLGMSERIELNSDHIPLIVEYRVAAALNAPKTRLLPRKANISRFRQRLEQLVNLNMVLSSPADIDDAAELFLRNINVAAEYSMLGQLACSPPSPTQPLQRGLLTNCESCCLTLRANISRICSAMPIPIRIMDSIQEGNGMCQAAATHDDPHYATGQQGVLIGCRDCIGDADELEGCFTPFALASPSQVQDTETFLNADARCPPEVRSAYRFADLSPLKPLVMMALTAEQLRPSQRRE